MCSQHAYVARYVTDSATQHVPCKMIFEFESFLACWHYHMRLSTRVTSVFYSYILVHLLMSSEITSASGLIIIFRTTTDLLTSIYIIIVISAWACGIIWAPRGFGDLGRMVSWGALGIILRELGSKLIVLGIKGALPKCNKQI